MNRKMWTPKLFFLAALLNGATAFSAQFTGTVTENNGTTAVANVPVLLYKYDAVNQFFSFVGSATTAADGKFTAIPSFVTDHLGSYYVRFGAGGTSFVGDPFSSFPSYYSDDPLSIYLPETYDDVTPLTPGKPPVLLTVRRQNAIVALGVIKLNRQPKICVISGPMTINGTPYSSFSSSFNGPKLPEAGGPLNIRFSVLNLGATAVTTQLQPVAFVSRRDKPTLQDFKSVIPFAKKNVTLKAGGKTSVLISATIPAALMAGTPASQFNPWAFNVGIQGTVLGLSNCFQMTLFPVLHQVVPTSGSVAATASEAPAAESEIIALELAEDGSVLKWGPKPTIGN